MVPRPERLTSLYRLVVPLPVDVPTAQRRLLLRIERRTWLLVLVVGLTAVLGHVLVGMLAPGVLPSLVGHGLVTTAAAVPITGLLLRQAFTHAAAVARQQAARRAEQAEAARVEAALLVARTAARRVNNALAPLAGYAD